MGWTKGPFLGRGSSATVYAATSTSGDTFAVKSVDYSQSENLKKEQHFLSILKSPHVVSYKGCDITRENNKLMYNLFMDYMAGGSIIDLLNARNGSGLSNLEIASYTRQIVKGLEYIHSCGVVHCDIKGTNILVDYNGVKIGDLGCAKWADIEMAHIRGTPMFMAPEVARGQEQGFPADIWALGCTIIEMMTGELPWFNINDPVSLLYRIAYSNETPEIPNEFCDQGRDFLSKCLVRDPKQRWTATQLLNHPYLQQFDENSTQTGCEKFVTSSPTSILDQDVWDSMDESSSSSSSSSSSTLVSTHFSESICASSMLKQRIKNMASKTSMMPKWANEKEEREWITVRRTDRVVGVVGDEMEVDLHLDQWR